jgi:O-antigen ligase
LLEQFNLFLIPTASNNERLILLQAAFEQFLISPFFGIGIGNFNNYAQNVLDYSFRATNLSPHNLFLELLAETGIFGLFLFMLPTIKLIILTFKKRSLNVFYLIVVFSLFFLFNTFSGVSRIFYSSFLSFSFYLLFDRNI